ncbi:YdeI/OmpD-associated family protein [uncultured Pontibacter sp.]|uniref:YdeI/OmpD-associated family protein n=1 Tax=uncultured Pontibacter sp. TaxID=453356 RepID=UPI002613360C|nr:YdeI/OmpD-associated family protein [uncultured Pontibacter sp.]
MEDQPLTDKYYLLEKFPGKGGWTYAALPEILPDKHAHFGWVRVKGTIGGYELKGYHLMPMGNGQLFLPVRAEIRKKIKKQAGDWVQIILYADNTPQEVPEELLLCLQDEPAAYDKFRNCTDGEQKALVDWIYSAKTDETKVERIVQTIEKLLSNQKLHEK